MQLLLDTAAELIAEKGVEGLTTTEVAARADISIGTLYQYFADREAIIATLVESHVEEVNRLLTEGFAGIRTLTIRSMVEVTVMTHVQFYRDNPSFVQMWVHGRLSPTIVARQRQRNIEMGKWLRSVADEFGLVREDAAEVGAWFAVEIGDRVLEMAFRRNPQGDDEMITEGIEMLVGYLTRYTTDAGRDGVVISILPKLSDSP